ncbi:MAG: hypothetical protein ACOC6Q_00670 [Patescibacteria group bacterium]
MEIEEYVFPKVSALYCYRFLLLFLFLILLPIIDGLEYLIIIKVLILIGVLLVFDFLMREIIISKFSPTLLYLFSVIIPSAMIGYTSADFLLNTTELNFVNLLKGYFAFVNYISAIPDIMALIGIVSGGLMLAPFFEKFFKDFVKPKKIKYILNNDIKFILILAASLLFYFYSGNWSQTYFLSYGILNTIYSRITIGLWKKVFSGVQT